MQKDLYRYILRSGSIITEWSFQDCEDSKAYHQAQQAKIVKVQYKKITSQDTLETLPKKAWWYYSNGQTFEGIYRATLHAILSRWYYKNESDKIDCAYIEIYSYL